MGAVVVVGGACMGVWVVEGVKQKPIVVDSTFILTDTYFPFILSVCVCV